MLSCYELRRALGGVVLPTGHKSLEESGHEGRNENRGTIESGGCLAPLVDITELYNGRGRRYVLGAQQEKSEYIEVLRSINLKVPDIDRSQKLTATSD